MILRKLDVVPKGKGHRSDIEKVKVMVKAGADIKDIYDVVSSFQALKFADRGLELYGKKRWTKPTVWWFYGATGTGKTKRALELLPNAWISGKNLKWWQGYECHDSVLIDDYRKDFCTFHELLRILDRYPYSVEIKGGSRQLVAKFMIITCPFTPLDLYENQGDSVNQLLRRIDKIFYFDGSLDQGSEVGGNNRTPTFISGKNVEYDYDGFADIIKDNL